MSSSGHHRPAVPSSVRRLPNQWPVGNKVPAPPPSTANPLQSKCRLYPHGALVSDTHFWSGASAVKFCSNRLGATGKEWLLLVVALYFLAAFARQPLQRMILATRCLPTTCPSSRSRRVILGEPGRPFSSSKIRLISPVNNWFTWLVSEGGLCRQS